MIFSLNKKELCLWNGKEMDVQNKNMYPNMIAIFLP